MKFALTRVAAGIGMVIAAGSAQAVLTSTNTLSIQNDAVTSQTSSGGDIVVSNGPLLDSFFTVTGSKTPTGHLGSDYAYLYNGTTAMTLTGASQSNLATFRISGIAGDNAANTVITGTSGLSILSASGDAATINMSGWKVNWNGSTIPMGTGAWSTGYTSGVGNLTCTAGSGCAAGSAYTLMYTATILNPDPFNNVRYYLELHGTVGAVPEASTYGMMLAGLGLVGAMARRRKQAEANS
jgi:hypothetical protein